MYLIECIYKMYTIIMSYLILVCLVYISKMLLRCVDTTDHAFTCIVIIVCISTHVLFLSEKRV